MQFSFKYLKSIIYSTIYHTFGTTHIFDPLILQRQKFQWAHILITFNIVSYCRFTVYYTFMQVAFLYLPNKGIWSFFIFLNDCWANSSNERSMTQHNPLNTEIFLWMNSLNESAYCTLYSVYTAVIKFYFMSNISANSKSRRNLKLNFRLFTTGSDVLK